MAPERRTRSKIQELGLEAEVDALLLKGVTYENIAEHLEEIHGVTIGKSSVARRNEKLQRKLLEIRRVKESAEALAQVLGQPGDGPDTKIPDMLLNLIQATLMDKLSEEDLTNKDAVGLAIAGSQAVKAQETIERMRRNERERTRKAWEKVMAESKRMLESSGLWPQVEIVLQKGMREATAD